MSAVPIRLFAGNVPTGSPSTIYTPPAGLDIVLTSVVCANGAATALTLTFISAGTTLVPGVSIPANGVFTIDFSHAVGGVIQASASGTGLQIYMSGVMED